MHKTLFLILSLNIFSFSALSQLDKKTWLVGGLASYTRAKYNSGFLGANSNVEQYQFSISPVVGYFLVDKLCTGIVTSFQETGSREQATTIWSKFSNYNFGPFIRYYVLKKQNLVNIIAQGYYQFGAEGSTSGLNKSTIAFSAGPVLYFNSSIGLEFLLSHLTYKYRNITATDKKLQFSLGLQIHLERDK